MAMPSSGQCYTVIVPVFLVLVVGLLYTSYAFRIRDHTISANLEACTSGRCLTPKRGFETVSTRGGFANSKLLPPDEIGEPKKRDKSKLWSKLNKVESIGDNGEDIDSDDEIVQIEVEDDNGIIVIDEREKPIFNEKKEKEDLQKEEKKKKEKEENERREKEAEVRRKREEEKRLKKEKEDQRKKEEDERLKRVEEERRKKEEDERIKEQEEEQRMKEEVEQLRKRKEEQRKKEEEERLKEERRKIEEEERLKEEERRKKEEEKRLKEEERRKKEEEERLKEEERRKKEEEERLKEEERRKKEEEERLKEEERRKKEEEELLQEEEECRLKEEEQERKKQEEEKLRKEREERKLKEKQEADRKREEKLALEADKRRKEEENKKRVERLKKDAEQQKLREMEEKKKRSQSKNDDNDDDNGDDEKVPLKNQKKIEQIKLVSKTEAKSKLKIDNQLKTQSTKKPLSNTSKPKSKENTNSASMSLAELNDMILSVPTFMPNFTAVEDPVCQQHGKIFLRQLRGYKLWALQMLDSSAKIPSGLLRGNVNQLGDFDQCLEVLARVKIDEKTIKVQGKYCLASMDIYATHSAAKLPVNLIQGRSLIRGNMRDPGHFVPKFTTVNWALCLPAACSAKDARKSIENALDSYNMTIGMKFMVDVDPDMCYVKQKVQSYSKETIGALYFFAFIICLTIAATLRDYFATLHEKGSYSERIIMSFSLKRTVKALFSNIEQSPSDIGCIHGIRSLATIALYAAHKLIPMSRMPYANRVSLTETANHPLSTVLRASLVYTDSFLLLSGVLTAYNMAKELDTRGEIRWFCRLIARYVRLTPCLLAIIFWYAYVMEHIGSGPQWNAVVKSNADICKESSWINLLYVQNYFPFEEMCATHTHQLALDMQLFLIAPALVFFLQVKPILGIIIVFFLLQVSATLRYLATSNNNLSLVIFHGMTLKHLYKTANLTYALPLHRATPYLFGVGLGVLLHCVGKKLRMHKILALLGWLIALALGSWSLFSPWRLARRDYTYNVEEATYYAVVSPILTALALCYIIFACFTHNGGIINRVLSSYWMVVFSRLSYAIYLSQFAVFFYNVGTARYGSDFQPLRIIDPHEAIIVVSVSVVLTLLFDIPMQEVKNIIMECSDTLAEVEAEKVVENNAQQGIRNNVHKIPQDITPDEEEPAPGGWNWNRGTFTKSNRPEPREYEENGIEEYRSSRLKRQDIRRQSMIRSEAYDEWDSRNISRRTSRSEDDGRTSRSNYRLSDAGLDDLPLESYLHPRERYYSGGYSRSPMRDLDAPVFRRSVSRDRPLSKDQDIPNEYNRRPLITISKEEDYTSSRSPRSSMSRFNDHQRSLSSESEDPLSSRRSSGNYSRRLSTEPRVADEDEWEEELRIRRSRLLQERVSSQERERIPPAVEEEEENSQWDSLKRRSSAEGKMALLKEPFRPGNMELWTVSKMALGSSQEPDEEDEEMYLQQRREYREQEPPLREELEGEEDDSSRRRSFASESLPTSFDDEEEATNSNEFALTKSTRNLHVTVQDLSKLSHEDDTTMNNNWNKLDVKSGLFKRESIVKSQASEEDPEYLLPERPKLIEQEQEHPFKKAWQMQKSRSEEEGSSAFIVKEQAKMSPPLDKQHEEPEDKSGNEKTDQTGEQGNEIPEPDVTCEVTLVWQPRNTDIEDTRSSSKSIASSVSSAHINWPDEEEQFQNYRNRRKSDEEGWMWTEKDT